MLKFIYFQASLILVFLILKYVLDNIFFIKGDQND